jgi:hypothetical protein
VKPLKRYIYNKSVTKIWRGNRGQSKEKDKKRQGNSWEVENKCYV